MASLGLCPQFETNLMSNRKVIELLLQLKSAKAHGKNCTKVKPHLVGHLLRNCLLDQLPLVRSDFHETLQGVPIDEYLQLFYLKEICPVLIG